jgi:hypothetical protein
MANVAECAFNAGFVPGGSENLKLVDRPFEPGLDLLRHLSEAGIVNCLHGGDWIDGGNLNAAALILLHDDVAGQHGPDLVLKLQSAICELRVASAENPIGAKILAELRLERGSDVDIREDAETLALQRVDHARNCLIEGNIEPFGEMVVHRAARIMLQPPPSN